MPEILIQAELGQQLYNTVKQLPVNSEIVEIGGWDGKGSTFCMASALFDKCDKGSKLTSLEIVSDRYNDAKCLYGPYIKDGYNINLLHGKIVDECDVKQFVSNHINEFKDQQRGNFDRFYNENLNYMSNVPNVLSDIPSKIDFLFLDGGEYSTYLEWDLLQSRCHGFIGLDDSNMLKTKFIKNELIESPDWVIVFESNQRNGSIIAKKNE
tara:strand:+ start:1318 stop:1947 length:630 start_codon:yes stop_codon:yes gene_type:complete